MFAITFISPDPEVDLEVRCMGYETVVSTINNSTQIKNFILSEKSFVLKEFLLSSTYFTKAIPCAIW
jgi:hypothetical protein